MVIHEKMKFLRLFSKLESDIVLFFLRIYVDLL